MYKKLLSALFCLTSVGISQTIWTDSDFSSPKGYTLVSPANPANGGDLYIQNINPANFSANMSGFPSNGVLQVDSGGLLTADGEVIVERTGTTAGNVIFITNGGKSYFNGGLTAIMSLPTTNSYTITLSQNNSELHVTGDTDLKSETARGYGIYLGTNTKSSFNKDSSGNGVFNVSAGTRAIFSIGDADFNQEVHIKLNGNGIFGISSLNSTSPSVTNFNDKVYMTNTALNDNTSTSYAVYSNNSNGIFNFNDGIVINFDDTYTNGNEFGLHSASGTINAQGDITIKTNSGTKQAILSTSGNGKINIQNSTADLKGDILLNNGKIDIQNSLLS